MLKNLREGDLVVVTRTDRLARSIFQMFRIVSQLVDAGANFRELAQPMADTSTSSGRMYLAILGGLAEIERELIASRTAESLERKASGEPLTDIARSYNVSHMTIRPPV